MSATPHLGEFAGMVAEELVARLATISQWVGIDPSVGAWSLAAIGTVAVASRLRTLRWRRRDPLRLFSDPQRVVGRVRAQERCEYGQRWAPWRRCPAPAQEADHFWPWSRGGATTMDNLVAACRWHNRSKGGRMPSVVTAAVIARRRGEYFPADVRRRPGAWYR